MLKKVIVSCFILLASACVMGNEYHTQNGTVRIVGNEPHTKVVFDNGKEILEFSSMYQEGMRKFQNKQVMLNYFYVKRESKPNSIQRSLIGLVKVTPMQK